MGAGENLPLNVLCEDGDISYRLFCYSVTGANTWVSLMQTTTILHVGTPPNPFLNCNNVPIRSPSSELLFSRKNMLWVRIRGVGCVSSYGFSLPPLRTKAGLVQGKNNLPSHILTEEVHSEDRPCEVCRQCRWALWSVKPSCRTTALHWQISPAVALTESLP